MEKIGISKAMLSGCMAAVLAGAAIMPCAWPAAAQEVQTSEAGSGSAGADHYSAQEQQEILDELFMNQRDSLRTFKMITKLSEPAEDTADNQTEKVENNRKSDVTLDGIDVSHWQSGINLKDIDADFVIVKASGGTSYKDPDFRNFADTILGSGKLLGFYHFGHDDGNNASAQQEATFFYEQVKDYLGKGIPVLDYEAKSLLSSGTGWAYEFLNTFYQLSGVKCMLYTSQWYAISLDWSKVASEGYPLWVAAYGENNVQEGYKESVKTPLNGTGHFAQYWMHQYGSQGRLPGYDGNLDINKFYGSADDWKQLSAMDESPVLMLRVYNPNSGEHFYTASENERNSLVSSGWQDEGQAWHSTRNGTPVYRLYNPNSGDHHYTLDLVERNYLIKEGWWDEGMGWMSNPDKTVPVYRLYNPNAVTGTHHYTTDREEADKLVKIGWRDEGIGWYGQDGPKLNAESAGE